eukprot:CAMPEP_0183717056 /NCGR_PEP_ID=MMETSP0737-20130205/10772_1 /TAXON_ID=385413 /ORGANISM="Thalassiosira miniscula, Strain CCMP1093" /LENGTH=116 /DNA_ID=CAMNT_0025946419 /DNA_START=84 /DNA_END=431 /DNA_ORIENTATION=-
MKDALSKKDFVLSTMENELSTQNEKINLLSKSLAQKSQEQHSNKKVEKLEKELDDTNAYLDSCLLEKEALLLELENAKQEHKIAEENLSRAISETTEQLNVSHAKSIKELRAELES